MSYLTIMEDPRAMPNLDQFVLSRGTPRPRLVDRGLITEAGEITPAGVEALRQDGEARHEDALHRNVVGSIGAERMIVLGKLIRGEPLNAEERQAARSVELVAAVDRDRAGNFTVNAFGRKLWVLAAGRTY